MAEQRYFEGFDAQADEFSKSAAKREAQAVRKLIERIADLGEQSFKTLIMPEDVKEAILVARKLKPRSDERRRQLQYAAKLQRSYPQYDLEDQVLKLGLSSKEDPNTMKLEKLREKMIQGSIQDINNFCSLVIDTDRSKLRHLVKKAKEEASKTQMLEQKPASRALFKFLKAETARSGADLAKLL